MNVERPAPSEDHSQQESRAIDWSLDLPEVPEEPATKPMPARKSQRVLGQPDDSPPPSVVRILEAILFVGPEPLSQAQAQRTVRGLTPEQFEESLQFLTRSYRQQGRPYHIERSGEGYVLALRPQFRWVIDRLWNQQKEARLTVPALEVLSIVAYRQPVTKQQIDGLRGYESGALIRLLVRRGLLSLIRSEDANDREPRYGTTGRFLELFHLQSLADLPETEDLSKL
jgi:segregation and condensation protein B